VYLKTDVVQRRVLLAQLVDEEVERMGGAGDLVIAIAADQEERPCRGRRSAGLHKSKGAHTVSALQKKKKKKKKKHER
jgi:hypothetical protein